MKARKVENIVRKEKGSGVNKKIRGGKSSGIITKMCFISLATK